MDPRAAASSRSPTCYRSSNAPACATPCGSPPTCTTLAAHYYDPNRAQFQDFEPFWEFVSGPIHAGTFGPNELDNTFGPQLMYMKAPAEEQGQNVSPAFGLQFFGHVAIDGADRRDDGDAEGRRRPRALVDQIEPKVG